MKAIEDTMYHVKWCNEYIDYYVENCDFDPLAALTETEDRDQAMFHLCIDYLYGIEQALEKAGSMFEAQRNSIVFKDRRTA